MALSDGVKPGYLRPAVWRQVLNTALCVGVVLVLVGFVRKHAHFFPITAEAICQIALAEMNRRKSKRRTQDLNEAFLPNDYEKGLLSQTRCLASVVGYREESELFTRVMHSYRDCPGLETLLIGIDGNEPQDLEMANIVGQVFPDTVFIALDERLADKAMRQAREYVDRELKDYDQQGVLKDWTWDDLPTDLRHDAQEYALKEACVRAAEILEKHDVLYSSPGSLKTICIHQPHINKKGIMFTNMIFSTVLGKQNHISYLWTSDSDTVVTATTLPLTIGCMESDPKIGGSCSTLGIHNDNDSFISRMGAAIYWAELGITRGQSGAVDAVDCQPGPCAAFRLDALSPILFAWYTQTSLGIKTIVNEDRHLTTKLLLDGWKVTFNTEAIAFTDTPTTLLRWLLQQVRWARATQIETFQYPQVYAIHGPILFMTAVNRFYGPLAVIIFTARYVFNGQVVRAYSISDVLLRVVLCTTYNHLAYRRYVGNFLILALSQVFFQLPLPGIVVYASFTALEGGWGTSMRNRKETVKARGAGWEHLGMVSAVAAWVSLVAAAFVKFSLGHLGFEGAEIWMLVAAVAVMGSLYYTLLREGARG